MSEEVADIIERLRRAAPFMRATGNTGIIGQHAGTCEEAATEIKRLRHLLGRIIYLIEAAGLDNLTNGVQLGPTSWFVKMSDAIAAAKELLPPDPNKQ